MSRTLEVPDELYERLKKAAAEFHMTPLAWLDYQLPTLAELTPPPAEAGSLYDQVKDLIGTVRGVPLKEMKEDPNDPFFNILLQKKREGTL